MFVGGYYIHGDWKATVLGITLGLLLGLLIAWTFSA